jgi:hypothetical protein
MAGSFGFLLVTDRQRKKIFQELPMIQAKCDFCGHEFTADNPARAVTGASGILSTAYEGKPMHKRCIRQLKKNIIKRS